MLRFIVDTQLFPVLTSYLRRKGYDATHTTNYPQAQYLADQQIRQIALAEDRIIITKDDEFLDYYWAKGAPPKLFKVAIGNIRNNDLIDLFEFNLQTINKLFEDNAQVVVFGRNSLVSY
jgi:predicted nuclease of predicted toxin-antitoxin system